MKLAYFGLSGLLLEDGQDGREWIIEAPRLFAGYVQELLGQLEGQEGRFVLSEGEKTLNMAKTAAMIDNPLTVDINEKKLVNRLYAQLKEIAFSEACYLKTQEVSRCICEYLLELEQQTDYILTLQEELDWTGLFKAAGIQHETYEENPAERLSRYIRLLQEALGVRLVIFLNLRSYLEDDQLAELLRDARYQGLRVLLIENQEKACIAGLPQFIIDADGCEIY